MKIKIIKRSIESKEYDNALPGSTHQVVDPPESHIQNGIKGYVWIMGKSEKILLPPGDFELLLELE